MVLMSKDTELHYIAGLMDGEGSIMLMKRNGTDKYRCPQISMTSTTFELVKLMRDRFGGCIRSQKVYQAHHKQSWSWLLTYDKALDFCSEICYLLREPKKRKRAEFLSKGYKLVTPRNGKYTEAMAEKKEQFEKDFVGIE